MQSITDLYTETDLTIGEIAREVGVSIRTVHRRLNGSGVKRRGQGVRRKGICHSYYPPRVGHLDNNTIHRMYIHEGNSLRIIASKLGVTYEAIRLRLKKFGGCKDACRQGGAYE